MFLKACAALLGALAAAQALPAEPSAVLDSATGARKNGTAHSRKCSAKVRQPKSNSFVPPSPTPSEPHSSSNFVPKGEQTATFSTSQPTVTLSPSTHWETDTRPLANVQPISPGKPSQLYYGSGDPSKAGYYSFLRYDFTLPSVNIDHSDRVTITSASTTSLTVTFRDQESFDLASKTWSTKEGLVLIASAEGCGDYAKGDRCYFKVSGLDLDPRASGSREIRVTGQPTHPDKITSGGETEWGWWTPSGPKQRRSAPATPVSRPMSDKEMNRMTRRPPHRRAAIERRWFWDTIWNGIKDAANSVYNAISDALSIDEGAEKSFEWRLPDPSKSEHQTKEMEAKPAESNITSPWKNSILLKSFGSQENEPEASDNGTTKFLNIYCVECGTWGSAKIAGRLKWSLLKGFTQGRLEFHSDVVFSLKIGIDAQMTYKKTFTSKLFEVALPGLTYGAVTIGPFVSLGSRVTIEAAAKGTMLAGAEMGLKDAHVIVDLVHSSESEAAGWKPYFTPVFEAKGEIMLSAELGLPLGLYCGLEVGELKTTIGIIEEPSIKGVAQVSASAGLTDNGTFVAGFDEVNGCTGISTDLTWRNKVLVDILGMEDFDLSDSGYVPLEHGCIPSIQQPDYAFFVAKLVHSTPYFYSSIQQPDYDFFAAKLVHSIPYLYSSIQQPDYDFFAAKLVHSIPYFYSSIQQPDYAFFVAKLVHNTPYLYSGTSYPYSGNGSFQYSRLVEMDKQH